MTTCSKSVMVTGKTDKVLSSRALMPGRSLPVTVTSRVSGTEFARVMTALKVLCWTTVA